MGRKTIEVDYLINEINEFLATDTSSREARKSMLHLLERVLHNTKNYRGFTYLGENDVPAGQLPGISGKFGDRFRFPEGKTDNTRVRY
jgi:hypothetical protein